MFFLKINKNNLTSTIKSVQKKLTAYPNEVYTKFVEYTPVRTGNARRKTRLLANKTINARYAYARRLDNGYSRQSPRGMTRPTKIWARRRLKQILRKR